MCAYTYLRGLRNPLSDDGTLCCSESSTWFVPDDPSASAPPLCRHSVLIEMNEEAVCFHVLLSVWTQLSLDVVTWNKENMTGQWGSKTESHPMCRQLQMAHNSTLYFILLIYFCFRNSKLSVGEDLLCWLRIGRSSLCLSVPLHFLCVCVHTCVFIGVWLHSSSSL